MSSTTIPTIIESSEETIESLRADVAKSFAILEEKWAELMTENSGNSDNCQLPPMVEDSEIDEQIKQIQECHQKELEEQKAAMTQQMEQTVKRLKKQHEATLDGQRRMMHSMLDGVQMRAQIQATEEISLVKEEAKKVIEKVNQEWEKRLEVMMEEKEELQAQIEILKCKPRRENVEDIFDRIYYDDSGSEVSEDEGPSPTDDFTEVSADDMKKTFQSMSEGISKSMETVKWQSTELKKQADWMRAFLMANQEQLEKMKIEGDVPEAVDEALKELKKKKEMELDNEMCRNMDKMFVESLINFD